MSPTGLARYATVFVLAMCCAGGAARAQAGFQAALARGIQLREAGNLTLALDALRQAVAEARSEPARTRAAAELGATLLLGGHPDQAEPLLRQAYAASSGAPRAVHALALGNLAAQRRQRVLALQWYGEARQLDPGPIGLRAGLNAAALEPAAALLDALFAQIEASGAPDAERAPLLLNLGQQALAQGAPALAQHALAQAARLLAGQAPSRLTVELLDSQAGTAELAGQLVPALAQSRQALAQLARLAPGQGELAIPLEARLGRLYRQLGQAGPSLAAYLRAAERIDAMRADIPIDLDDGSSSYRSWFEPVYLGLVDGLLAAAARDPAQAGAHLRRARDVLEALKQAELQDYLGDRCTVDEIKGDSGSLIPAASAVLYPVLLADHVELLIESADGIAVFRSGADAAQLRAAANAFAAELRSGSPAYARTARQLYDWLLRPLQGFLAANGVSTLIVVPDGALRLVPFGALHDGQRFAIEALAITTVTGMSMTNTSVPAALAGRALVAGASQFGPVVDKFAQTAVGQRFAAQLRAMAGGETRRLRAPGMARAAPDGAPLSMREALALPGVASEIDAVGRLLPGTHMLDAGFTVAAFSAAAQQGGYSIVHVASHGVFGGSGAASFVLAYDDLLTLDGLQALLRSEGVQRHPIELLTLSACETAEGDERAPLGMSGAAIKARAKSVLGALWPVEDAVAVRLMGSFYAGIGAAQLSKAQALRRAQLELIGRAESAQPWSWAPFVLIGNWL
ncbi:MAG: CHAT domain-containing protein [Pseudomonadota bacterium]